MHERVVVTKDLAKFYGRRRGLDGLDLQVRQGEVYGFLGPNGAGKTTTIRLLLGLLRPTVGTVRVLGSDPRAGGARLRRRIGYLQGELALGGRDTAGELLAFLGDLRGGVRRQRIAELAGRLQLDLSRPIRGLSRATSGRSAWSRRSWVTRSC